MERGAQKQDTAGAASAIHFFNDENSINRQAYFFKKWWEMKFGKTTFAGWAWARPTIISELE